MASQPKVPAGQGRFINDSSYKTRIIDLSRKYRTDHLEVDETFQNTTQKLAALASLKSKKCQDQLLTAVKALNGRKRTTHNASCGFINLHAND
jgi:hypothetical protein